MNLKQMAAILSILMGLSVLGGGSWGAFALVQQVGYNTSWRLIQTFERLDLIRKKRRLTQVEWLSWCQAGLELNIFRVCPPR